METFDPEVEAMVRRRAKTALRKRARALRGAIPPQAIAERSARIVARLRELPAIVAARSVALFWPIEGRNEVDLTALDAELRAAGKRVAYPSIADGAAAAEEQDPAGPIPPAPPVMTFRFVDDPSAMEERGLGFREPDPAAPEATTLDVIVVPALLVDGAGHRIGYGGGYYDRALPRFAPPALAVAVAFSFQLIAEVPVTEGDVAVASIVTDDAVINAATR